MGISRYADYKSAAEKLAIIYRDSNEMHKCQDTIDKFVNFVREHGDRLQYVDALSMTTPEGPLYAALEGRFPHPAKTYETMAQVVEAEDKKRINTLIGERRTRIGARVAEVTLEVKREVMLGSPLEHIYRKLIDWATDDEVRRRYEEKLLQYCYDKLVVTPAGPKKAKALADVRKQAEGMVIIKHPFRLAWEMCINWRDAKEIKDWDATMLREYCTLFPETDLCKVIMGFATSAVSPFPRDVFEPTNRDAAAENAASDESEDDDDGGAPTAYVPLTEEDRLVMITDGTGTTPSLFAYRLFGEYYQHLQEHESIVEMMRTALEHLKTVRSETGLGLQNTEDAYSVYLGTALVYYQSPRHHAEAKSLFDRVLKHDPQSTRAMIGVGLIYEEEEDYDSAVDFLDRALKRDSSNLRVRVEAAWVKALRCEYQRCKEELETCLELLAAPGKDADKELVAQTRYRLGQCIWNMETSKAARKDRKGAYAWFMASLKSDVNFAPAYTSLGIYYADYAKDKKRAQGCFLKAVELSSSEVHAAERLARLFADEGEWDRVELVAQRVVDSGKVRPPPGSKKKGISWPFAALGVAELNKRDFARAVASFQAALKISPNDYHSWIGLGESYANAGRYIAATKAITHAQTIETPGADAAGDAWFAKYLLANVKRELGEFDDAVGLYREVNEARPGEEGVVIALMQCMVESAADSISKGLFGKAVDLAIDTISFASTVSEATYGNFNFWRSLGDACSVFSIVQGRVSDFPAERVKLLITSGGPEETLYGTMSDVDGVGTGVVFARGIFPDSEKLGVDLTRAIHASLLCHKRAVHVSSHDAHARSVAYYNLGWAEHRAHACLPANLRSRSSRYLKAAIRCFKRSIELEAGNAEFWNALGVVTSSVNARVAQHAFVRSLHINERDAQVWANLGTLALLNGDALLANQAFTRAQSQDPSYAKAWLGQGFVAIMFGDLREARSLFAHAMDISEASSLICHRQYSLSLFDHIVQSPPRADTTSLIQPLFALHQLRTLAPADAPFHHLSTLFLERAQDVSTAVAILERLSRQLHEEHEQTKSLDSLSRLVLAKTDLARSHLAAGAYEPAIETANYVLDSTSDAERPGRASTQRQISMSAHERLRVRLSANLTAGIAHLLAGRPEDAVAYLDAAIALSLARSSGDAEPKEDPDVVCLLAQVLWATGTPEARERARDALFGVLETTPNHVPSVLLLGVVALLDEDAEALDAVAAELSSLRLSESVSALQREGVEEVLEAIVAVGRRQDEEEDGEHAEERRDAEILERCQTAVMLHPHLPRAWLRLSEAAVAVFEHVEECDTGYPAEMAVRVARRAIPPRADGIIVTPEDLAVAYAATGDLEDAQRSIAIAPWRAEGWASLAEGVAAVLGGGAGDGA